MLMATLRDKCKDLNLEMSGDKQTLVARLATFDIDTIAAELSRKEQIGTGSQGKNYGELIQRLHLAVKARADQVYNVKKQYLMDEMEEIKAELINIKFMRDEEKKAGMKQYSKEIVDAREKMNAVDAQGKKPDSSQEIVGGTGVQGSRLKPKRKMPLVESTRVDIREVKKFKYIDEYDTESSWEDEDDGDGGYQYLQYLTKKAMLSPVP
ncbi:hypothetical protein N431DRAFT_512902 [Stipitochalara longipes BDJ]|nr:hypothetical protein N431DRAFT_512902 [Stipitochalara longipes BDJ]